MQTRSAKKAQAQGSKDASAPTTIIEQILLLDQEAYMAEYDAIEKAIKKVSRCFFINKKKINNIIN